MASRLTTALQQLRTSIDAIDGFKATFLVRAFSKLNVGDVLLLPFTLRREPAGGGKQRHFAEILVIVRSKFGEQDASTPAASRTIDDVDTVYEAIPSSDAMKAGGAAGIEEVTRGAVQWIFHPQADAGAASGGVFLSP